MASRSWIDVAIGLCAKVGEANRDRTRIWTLERETRELRAVVAKPQAAVERFEARLDQNSTNSSMPPSSDMTKGKASSDERPDSAATLPDETTSASDDAGEPMASEDPVMRKAGGQAGHEGTHRPLLDVSKVDRVHDQFPQSCGRCAGALSPMPDDDATRMQPLERSPLRPDEHEHRLHGVACACGHVARATMPRSVPNGMYGVRALANTATGAGSFRVSKRNMQRLLST